MFKKLIFFAAFLELSIQPSPSYAQIVDVFKYVSAMEVSENFTNHLHKCEPFTEQYNTTLVNAPISVKYEVKGKKQGKCEIFAEAKAHNHNYGSSLKCTLDDPMLQILVFSLKKYLQQKPNMNNLADMVNNPDYRSLMSIFANENLCIFKIDNLDLTKEFRKHLFECSPFQQINYIGPRTIERSIKGKKGENCIVDVNVNIEKVQADKILDTVQAEVLQEALAKFPANLFYKAKCHFSMSDTMEYVFILKNQVINSDNKINEIAKEMENKNFKNEYLFLNKKCQISSSDIELFNSLNEVE